MRIPARSLWRTLARLVPGGVALSLLAVACAPHATQDTLKPAGPYARKIDNLFEPVFWIATAIFVIVEGMLLLFVVRYRHRKGRRGIPPQVHGNQRLEIAWTIVPALILVGVAVPTVSTIYDLARKPSGRVLEVNVIGHQWWWEFDYPSLHVITANELHIPVGEPVYASLCAGGFGYQGVPAPSSCETGGPKSQPPAGVGASVIHSFWVPQLAGKQDVVPGRTNHVILQADHPGVYTGQCAEFCGLSHAYMRLKVVAQTPSDFDAWVRQQQADAAVPAAGSLAAQGRDLFNGVAGEGTGLCIQCHAVQGLKDANGNPAVQNGGPNLTHLMSRDCFAGCIFTMNQANLERWLHDPPAVKPGSWMPDYGLTDQQVKALVAYLMTLK
jgi:cytochrome c oxidase subunit II